MRAPERFSAVELDDGRCIRFLGVIPLYEDEMEFKLERGTDALLQLFDAHDVTDVVDVRRPSVIP